MLTTARCSLRQLRPSSVSSHRTRPLQTQKRRLTQSSLNTRRSLNNTGGGLELDSLGISFAQVGTTTHRESTAAQRRTNLQVRSTSVPSRGPCISVHVSRSRKMVLPSSKSRRRRWTLPSPGHAMIWKTRGTRRAPGLSCRPSNVD